MDREKWTRQGNSFLGWTRRKAAEGPEQMGFLPKKEALAIDLGWNPSGNCKSRLSDLG